MATEVHVSDIGTILRLTIRDQDKAAIDVSGATTKQIILRKTDQSTTLTKTASNFSDGTDGIIQYTTVSGDLTPAGPWKIQGRIVLSGGADFRTEIKDFDVIGNL